MCTFICAVDITVLQSSSLQLASVILKQYVEVHWCPQAEKFHPPETTEAVSSFYIMKFVLCCHDI